MKKVITILGIAALLLTGCKEEKNTDNEVDTPAEQAEVETDNTDYEGLGMKDENLPEGLTVGDNAPDVVLEDENKKRMSLEGYYAEKPVVLFFYRGYWCPVCTRHLSAFAEDAKTIEDAGAKLIAVTSESYDNVNKTKESTGADFTIVSDSDGKIMEAFDVDFEVRNDYQDRIEKKLNASIRETNANGKAVLPVPATYIIDTDGKIVYKQFNPDYNDRASVQDIVDNLPKK